MRRAWSVLLVLACVTTASAHDTWLLPVKARVQPGEVANFELTSAGEFPKPESAVRADRLVARSFRVAGATSTLEPRPGKRVLHLSAKAGGPRRGHGLDRDPPADPGAEGERGAPLPRRSRRPGHGGGGVEEVGPGGLARKLRQDRQVLCSGRGAGRTIAPGRKPSASRSRSSRKRIPRPSGRATSCPSVSSLKGSRSPVSPSARWPAGGSPVMKKTDALGRVSFRPRSTGSLAHPRDPPPRGRAEAGTGPATSPPSPFRGRPAAESARLPPRSTGAPAKPQ